MTEHEAARAWREAMNLSRAELAELIGYSPEAVQAFERGHQSNGEPAGARSWRRYKAACLLASILLAFDKPEFSVDKWRWGDASVATPTGEK
jgi:transcriptional regulator with XRE-family HTH domain